MNKRQIVIEIICFLFIVLFVYAAVMKLMDVEKFRVQIGQSPMLTPFAHWVAWVIPLIEICIAILLSIVRYRHVGLYMSFGLMVLFSGYIIAMTQFSVHVPCSCGGVLEKMGWTEHLVFNISYSLLGALAIMLTAKKQDVGTTNGPEVSNH